jgi:nitronate monooxygenase
MARPSTRFTRLPSELPIVQAPMAGGPSTPALTAAVAEAGGYGVLAAGYLSADELVELIASTRVLTGAPFGVNLFVPGRRADSGLVSRYATLLQPEAERLGVALGEPLWEDDAFGEKLDVVATTGVHLVSFTFGGPDASTADRLHGAGCLVAVTVTSPAEAEWATTVGTDLLIVQGTEAGGHQGAFLDLTPNRRSLLPLGPPGDRPSSHRHRRCHERSRSRRRTGGRSDGRPGGNGPAVHHRSGYV